MRDSSFIKNYNQNIEDQLRKHLALPQNDNDKYLLMAYTLKFEGQWTNSPHSILEELKKKEVDEKLVDEFRHAIELHKINIA